MPRHVMLSKYALVGWFSVIALWALLRGGWVVAILLLIAVIGLSRNLKWGCNFAVGLQLIMVIGGALAAIPGPGNPHPLGTAFYQLPLRLQQFLYVGSAALLLLPLVSLSHHIKALRSGWW